MQIPWIPRLWCLHYSLLYAMTSYGFRKKLFIGKTYMNGTSLCGTQVKCLGACAPTSILMFCVMPTKLVLWQVMTCLQVCSPYTPVFNIMQFIVIKPMQFDHLLQTAETVFIKDIHFKTTFMRWVTHDTSHSNFTLQEETLLWQQHASVSS